MSNLSNYLLEIEKRLEDNGCGEVTLKGTCLGECSCESTGSHNRFKKQNTRSKVETIIVEHIKENFPNQTVNLLSVGSGKFLQDYLLVLKLLKAGVRSINLTMIEPDKDQKAYEDFVNEMVRLQKEFPELDLQYSRYDSVNDIANNNRNYDVTYAIDYDAYLSFYDHSSRQLDATRTRRKELEQLEDQTRENESNKSVIDDATKNRKNEEKLEDQNRTIDCFLNENYVISDESDKKSEMHSMMESRVMYTIVDDGCRYIDENENSSSQLFREFKLLNKVQKEGRTLLDDSDPNPMDYFEKIKYTAAIDLMKADFHANRSEKNKSLTIVSRGQDIISLSSNESIGSEYPFLSTLIPNPSEISAFYINANISHLINNISYFSSANKPLIINANIIEKNDRPVVEGFLKNHHIAYEVIDEKNTQQLEQYQRMGLVAVLDYTLFDSKKNEKAIPEELNKKNIFVVRCDWVNHTKAKKGSPSQQFFPPIHKARRLVVQEPTADNMATVEAIDKDLVSQIDKKSGLKPQKIAYLALLKAKIESLDEETKQVFALYLLGLPKHLLKQEGGIHKLLSSYSLQTRSFQDAMSVLLGNNIDVIHKDILINDYVLTRHVSSYQPANQDENTNFSITHRVK